MAAAGEDAAELELEVAAILCDFKKILRARDRRRRRRLLREKAALVIPSWGRRRLRSVLEVGKTPCAEERDGAASPDTPLAFLPEEEEEDDEDAKKDRAQAEWVQQQRVVVASLSRENADLLKQIEEYRARLLSSRSANESLKHLHKVRKQQQEEQTRKMVPALALRTGTTTVPTHRRTPSFAAPVMLHGTTMVPTPRHPLARRPLVGLDLNDEPVDEAMAAQERYWQAQKAAAEARRRRLEILRAKVASPLASCRTRRVVG